MKYRPTVMKIDQLIGYLNDDKINLNPAFQRGRVWDQKRRSKLLRNIIMGKPIPAIFLYKEAAGSQYAYNILDGKQRIESIILFVGNNREDLQVTNWKKFFFLKRHRDQACFPILDENDKEVTFEKLGEEDIRDFKEYEIPTVEITLDDESTTDEVVSLFIDINQQGVAVTRFQIVKAMHQNNQLLREIIKLIALKQRRQEDFFYKIVKTDFSRVLGQLGYIERTKEMSILVERMWEKLVEIALYQKTRIHRKPVDILKSFISGSDIIRTKLQKSDMRNLKYLFKELRRRLALSGTYDIKSTSFIRDQTQFYTLVMSLIDDPKLLQLKAETFNKRIRSLNSYLKEPKAAKKKIRKKLIEYSELSSKHTTDVNNRKRRNELFLDIFPQL